MKVYTVAGFGFRDSEVAQQFADDWYRVEGETEEVDIVEAEEVDWDPPKAVYAYEVCLMGSSVVSCKLTWFWSGTKPIKLNGFIYFYAQPGDTVDQAVQRAKGHLC